MDLVYRNSLHILKSCKATGSCFLSFNDRSILLENYLFFHRRLYSTMYLDYMVSSILRIHNSISTYVQYCVYRVSVKRPLFRELIRILIPLIRSYSFLIGLPLGQFFCFPTPMLLCLSNLEATIYSYICLLYTSRCV